MRVFCAALDIECSVFIALSMSAPPFPSRGCPLCSSQILAVVLCFFGEVIVRCYGSCGLISCG